MSGESRAACSSSGPGAPPSTAAYSGGSTLCGCASTAQQTTHQTAAGSSPNSALRDPTGAALGVYRLRNSSLITAQLETSSIETHNALTSCPGTGAAPKRTVWNVTFMERHSGAVADQPRVTHPNHTTTRTYLRVRHQASPRLRARPCSWACASASGCRPFSCLAAGSPAQDAVLRFTQTGPKSNTRDRDYICHLSFVWVIVLACGRDWIQPNGRLFGAG